MRYYLIAGEASGDLHGSNLMKALKQEDKNAEFRYFGGDLMQEVGGELVTHYKDTAFMGFLNVVLNLGKIRKNLKFCKQDILSYQPDVLILIDYPGFNLRIAEFAHRNNIKVFYYISPKIWAWKEFRIKKIKKYVDEMFTILPFETEFYKKHDFNVHYVGNPLLDTIHEFRKNIVEKEEFLKENHLDDKPIIALLSGSRKHEVEWILPVMLEASKSFTNHQLVIAGVNSLDKEIYDKLIKNYNVKIIYNQTYELLHYAEVALVASGTAALETALFNTPQIVLYKMEGGKVVHYIMKNFFLKVNWVSLPNLILNKEAVKELLQNDLTVENVKNELDKLLNDADYQSKIKQDYQRLFELMGETGSSQRAAKKMVEILSDKNV